MEKLTATTFLLLTIAILSVGATTPLDKLHAHKVITTSVETLSHPVVYVETNRLPAINIRPQIIRVDTIPVKKQDRRKIIKTENGHAIEITMEDGQISNLKIDGKEIPADEYDQHEKLVADLVVEFDNIPTPPTPPQMMTDFPVSPTPPSPPTFSDGSSKKIIKMEDGTERVVIISDETMEETSEKMIKVDMQDGTTRIVTIDTEETIELETQEHQKQMEQHHKQMEKHHKEMEKHHEKMAEHRKEIMEKHTEKMEEHRKKMDEHREKMETKRIEMEKEFEEMEELVEGSNQIIVKNVRRANNEINEALEDQLLADGLIDSREKYKFELSGKKLKVNRKTQSDAMHQKYKQLYGELSGGPFSDKSKVVISKN